MGIEGGGRRYDQWITLQASNLDYVASVTGIDKTDLRRILRKSRDRGHDTAKVPLNTNTFTREER